MAYLKRNKIGKFWPVSRKGTKYVAVANHNKNHAIPLCVVMRDIFKLVKNKKELKNILNEKNILINHKIIKEPNYPVCLFDVITLLNPKKNYRVSLSKNNKTIFNEVSDKEAEIKIHKVMNKKILGKGKIQLNLMHGKNIFSNEKIEVGDSVVLSLKDNKLIKKIVLEKGGMAFVIKGKHAGYLGEIIEIMVRGNKKIAKILSDGEKINVWTKNIIMVE